MENQNTIAWENALGGNTRTVESATPSLVGMGGMLPQQSPPSLRKQFIMQSMQQPQLGVMESATPIVDAQMPMVATTTTATPNSSVAPMTPPSVPTSVKIVSGVLKAKSTITAYPSILALVVGIIVLICLLLLNPPFVHKRGMNPIYRREPDLFRAGIIALIVSALAYVTPIFILNKKSQNL